MKLSDKFLLEWKRKLESSPHLEALRRSFLDLRVRRVSLIMGGREFDDIPVGELQWRVSLDRGGAPIALRGASGVSSALFAFCETADFEPLLASAKDSRERTRRREALNLALNVLLEQDAPGVISRLEKEARDAQKRFVLEMVRLNHDLVTADELKSAHDAGTVEGVMNA